MCENVLNPGKPEGKFRLCFAGAVNCVLQRKTRRNHRDLPEVNLIPVCDICLAVDCL